MQELKSLKKATQSNRKLESISLGMIWGLREELADLGRAQRVQQREAMSAPPDNQFLYLELHKTPSMIREFLQNIMEPYRLDEEASISSASADSRTNSVDI